MMIMMIFSQTKMIMMMVIVSLLKRIMMIIMVIYTSDIYFQFGVNMHNSGLVHWQQGNTEMN